MEYKNINKCYSNDFMELYHCDCMELLKQTPDNYYSLALVDPPYGIGADRKNNVNKKQTKKSASRSKYYGSQEWDLDIPSIEYFNELKRVSKKQIIWGVNYYPYASLFVGGRLFWDKGVTMPTYSKGELAYLSWLNSIDVVKIDWHGMIQYDMKNKEIRIHPTQKPIALYDWILKNYAEPNQKLLDTHFGSGSIALAVDKANRLDKMNLHLTACEIDKEYIDKAIKRISESIKQGTLSF